MKYLVSFIGLLAIGLASGSGVNILDQHDEPISSIVEQVCWHTSGTGKQISKISTVAHIANHLSSLPADHKLAACSKLYLNSVNELASLVSISNNNVCSQEKINAIQQFHRNYILKESQRTSKTPKVLATFFMHYVYLVSQICAKETETFLGALNGTPEANTEEVDKLLAQLTERTGVSSSSSLKYSDMFLIWSMIDLLPLRNHHKIEKYLFEGKKRVVMVSKNSGAILKMQEFCHDKMKPLYSHSLLSTLKLIDMGYYPSDSNLANHLNDNKQARRFYELTRICETLLPVHVVEQEGQADLENVLLSRDEVVAMGLGEMQPEQEANETGCTGCSIVDVEHLISVESSEAVPITKRVKGNIKQRKGAVARFLKIFVKNIKANLSGKVKRIFAGEAPEEFESIDENQLDIYQISEEYEESDSDGQVVRTKRGVKKVLYTMLARLAQIVGVILFIVWGYVTTFILVPIGLILHIIGWFTGLKLKDLAYSFMTGFGAFPRRRD